MEQSTLPRMPFWVKIAFFLGDALLLGVALVIVLEAPHPLPLPHALLLTFAVANGAILFIIPFMLEYKAMVRLTEAAELRAASDQFASLEEVQKDIRLATGQWQTVQEHCLKAVAAAKEISETMIEEGKAFAQFSQKAGESEKAHMRLELEKLQRKEGEWLEVLVYICDHVFALYQAGLRSGQPAYAEQLGRFQGAIRDVARRVGLIPYEAVENEPFDDKRHQLADATVQAPAGSVVGETVATGYTFQGQAIRRIVVTLKEAAV